MALVVGEMNADISANGADKVLANRCLAVWKKTIDRVAVARLPAHSDSVSPTNHQVVSVMGDTPAACVYAGDAGSAALANEFGSAKVFSGAPRPRFSQLSRLVTHRIIECSVQRCVLL